MEKKKVDRKASWFIDRTLLMIKTSNLLPPKEFSITSPSVCTPSEPDFLFIAVVVFLFSFTAPVGSSDVAIIHIGLTFLTSSPSYYKSYLPLF